MIFGMGHFPVGGLDNTSQLLASCSASFESWHCGAAPYIAPCAGRCCPPRTCRFSSTTRTAPCEGTISESGQEAVEKIEKAEQEVEKASQETEGADQECEEVEKQLQEAEEKAEKAAEQAKPKKKQQ